MTVKELAMAKCKPLQSTNPKNLETRIEMGRHASMQTAETILASVEMTIKELKGIRL